LRSRGGRGGRRKRNRITFAYGDLELADFELKVVEFRFIDQLKYVQHIVFGEFHILAFPGCLRVSEALMPSSDWDLTYVISDFMANSEAQNSP
jgi:hypothetical protein